MSNRRKRAVKSWARVIELKSKLGRKGVTRPQMIARVQEAYPEVIRAENADLVISEAQYTEEEYQQKKGWGHSTWVEGVRVAKEANVKRLILFHHDPGHGDSFLETLVEQARSHFPNSDAAREGWSIRV